MFLAGHPSQGCFGLQSHCAPCYFFNQASFYPFDFSFINDVKKASSGNKANITDKYFFISNGRLLTEFINLPSTLPKKLVSLFSAVPYWWIPIVAGATETSRNITARVIERDTSGEIYYSPEDSRRFRTHQHGRQLCQNSRQLGSTAKISPSSH
ncbi:hypothetical protein TNCV_342451 [Trichonephila clavipes]|nr:hypothetical protein TNCV_342451 [Trichonephila clavipes]